MDLTRKYMAALRLKMGQPESEENITKEQVRRRQRGEDEKADESIQEAHALYNEEVAGNHHASHPSESAPIETTDLNLESPLDTSTVISGEISTFGSQGIYLFLCTMHLSYPLSI